MAVFSVAVFVVIQLLIPMGRFGDHDRAHRFGWQMFSVSVPSPTFTVVTDSGEQEVILEDYMARVRGDIDIVALMPPHLCQVVQGAIAVTWEDGVHQC